MVQQDWHETWRSVAPEKVPQRKVIKKVKVRIFVQQRITMTFGWKGHYTSPLPPHCCAPRYGGWVERAEESTFHENQEVAYRRAEQLANERNAIEAAIRAEQQQREQRAAADLKAQQGAIRARAAQVPPEPATGIQLAIALPDSTRILRKFSKDQSADDVFAFVANLKQLFDSKGRPIEFDLYCGMTAVERNQALEQQGMRGRVLLRVDI
jgi:hypothetical protein